MDRLETITLHNTLPVVFAGSENEEPIASSQVWMRDIEFVRPSNYLIEAESGTGKSSLCAYIYGNRRDYKGTILFNGRDIRDFTIKEWCELRRRHLAYLPQELRLFGELTAMENIMIKNELTHTFTRKQILEMLEYLEIGYKENQLASRLSVGQQQRVAIIRSLCQPFDFILLDEPVSHLDARNNLIVAELIAKIARDNDASIITTSVGNPLLLTQVQTAKTPESVKL